MPSSLVEKYFRLDTLPQIWCPGCGNGIVTRCITSAIEKAGLDKEKVCIVSGIGCSSRASGYLNFDTLHTTHGRALGFATGIKHANPDLKVIVITGDGDCSAIGGNHLIHACRRNIDITTIVYNNNIYGMTGGQYSPTTPTGDKATTAPYGNIDRDFDLTKLADAAGATYVARGTVYHATQLTNLILSGIKNEGFSLIEAISTCPTYYGRKNKKGGAVDLMKLQKENAIDVKIAKNLSKEDLKGKFVIGEFKNISLPEYTNEYKKITERFK